MVKLSINSTRLKTDGVSIRAIHDTIRADVIPGSLIHHGSVPEGIVGVDIPGGNEILKSPHSIDFDSKGDWYITDFQNKKVQKFSSKGEFVENLIDETCFYGIWRVGR